MHMHAFWKEEEKVANCESLEGKEVGWWGLFIFPFCFFVKSFILSISLCCFFLCVYNGFFFFMCDLRIRMNNYYLFSIIVEIGGLLVIVDIVSYLNHYICQRRLSLRSGVCIVCMYTL